MADLEKKVDFTVHCRTGSLEIADAIPRFKVVRSLPHRQLRNRKASEEAGKAKFTAAQAA